VVSVAGRQDLDLLHPPVGTHVVEVVGGWICAEGVEGQAWVQQQIDMEKGRRRALF